MSTVCNTVHYCCVCNGEKVLYAYNNGKDHEIEKLANLCLQKAPLHHRWYFQTMLKKTFGFLMEDEYIYFAIFDETIGNLKKLEFLERVRDAFKKVAKKGSKRIVSGSNLVGLQEQLLPVIRRLISLLECVDESRIPSCCNDTKNDSNGQLDIGASTKAPLLGKTSKQEKRKMRDHVMTVRESGVVEEHRKSVDKQRPKVESLTLHVNSQGGTLTKEISSVSGSRMQTVRNKWFRQVRIVLAIDVAVCLLLFVVWMVVCRGTECIG